MENCYIRRIDGYSRLPVYLQASDSNPAEEDMYALHFIFIPRLNMQLENFSNSYAHHRMPTARNLSPFQLWKKGWMEGRGDNDVSDGLQGDDMVIY